MNGRILRRLDARDGGCGWFRDEIGVDSCDRCRAGRCNEKPETDHTAQQSAIRLSPSVTRKPTMAACSRSRSRSRATKELPAHRSRIPKCGRFGGNAHGATDAQRERAQRDSTGLPTETPETGFADMPNFAPEIFARTGPRRVGHAQRANGIAGNEIGGWRNATGVGCTNADWMRRFRVLQSSRALRDLCGECERDKNKVSRFRLPTAPLAFGLSELQHPFSVPRLLVLPFTADSRAIPCGYHVHGFAKPCLKRIHPLLKSPSSTFLPTPRSSPRFSSPTMDNEATPMDTSTPSAPSTPPTHTPPPPPPPLPLPTPAIPLLPAPPSERPLTSFVGSLETATTSALRQNKWPLILLLPPTPRPVTAAPRPAWGPDAYHAPKRLHAPRRVQDALLLWRRTAATADAERYTAFFPVDGLPHLALLDPRSGERLAVWGNDGRGTHADGIDDALWELVVEDLAQFLDNHSLEDGALGPAHHREKPWAVRTRRVKDPKSDKLPPTSVMDDEDAAIAAAIAASLQDVREDSYDSESDDDHDCDDEHEDEDDVFSGGASLQDEDDGNDVNTVPDDFSDNRSMETGTTQSGASTPQSGAVPMSSRLGNIPPPPRRPVLAPSRGDPIPSSLESVSSSYLERMDSCLRSSTNTALMEARRLRQEQDAELAASLQEDRQREERELLEAERAAAKKRTILDATARLPDEPVEGPNAVTIAIRLLEGKRIMRRFNSFDPLQSVADFAIAETGCISVIDKSPAAALRIAGVKLTGLGWNTALRELGLSSRTMIILNE